MLGSVLSSAMIKGRAVSTATTVREIRGTEMISADQVDFMKVFLDL